MNMTKENQIGEIKKDIRKFKKLGYSIATSYRRGHPAVICQDRQDKSLYYAIAYLGQYDGYDKHLFLYAACQIEVEWVDYDGGLKKLEPKRVNTK